MLAALALGSNLPSAFGEPADNLHEALRRMQVLGRVTAVSSFLVTDPVGYLNQPNFTNAAALLETELGPLELLHALLRIERDMGRDRKHAPWKGPRIIDLDVLLYEGAGGSLTLNDPDLVLPHPAMHERFFVLESLAEIAPEWIHPLRGLTIRQLRDAVADVFQTERERKAEE